MEQCERRGKAATKRRRTGMTEYNADGKRREQHAACRPMPSTTWQYSPANRSVRMATSCCGARGWFRCEGRGAWWRSLGGRRRRRGWLG